jgi:hypothetical protein
MDPERKRRITLSLIRPTGFHPLLEGEGRLASLDARRGGVTSSDELSPHPVSSFSRDPESELGSSRHLQTRVTGDGRAYTDSHVKQRCGYASAFSRRDPPELYLDLHPLKEREGAGKAGCALHPRSRVPNAQTKTHTSIQVQRRQSGFPCAVGYDLFRALPGDRAFLPPSSARSLAPANLTPASGRQDHTASPSAPAAFVFRCHPRPPHPTARS